MTIRQQANNTSAKNTPEWQLPCANTVDAMLWREVSPNIHDGYRHSQKNNNKNSVQTNIHKSVYSVLPRTFSN